MALPKITSALYAMGLTPAQMIPYVVWFHRLRLQKDHFNKCRFNRYAENIERRLSTAKQNVLNMDEGKYMDYFDRYQHYRFNNKQSNDKFLHKVYTVWVTENSHLYIWQCLLDLIFFTIFVLFLHKKVFIH